MLSGPSKILHWAFKNNNMHLVNINLCFQIGNKKITYFHSFFIAGHSTIIHHSTTDPRNGWSSCMIASPSDITAVLIWLRTSMTFAQRLNLKIRSSDWILVMKWLMDMCKWSDKSLQWKKQGASKMSGYISIFSKLQNKVKRTKRSQISTWCDPASEAVLEFQDKAAYKSDIIIVILSPMNLPAHTLKYAQC